MTSSEARQLIAAVLDLALVYVPAGRRRAFLHRVRKMAA
jgi:hypothetical protein